MQSMTKLERRSKSLYNRPDTNPGTGEACLLLGRLDGRLEGVLQSPLTQSLFAGRTLRRLWHQCSGEALNDDRTQLPVADMAGTVDPNWLAALRWLKVHHTWLAAPADGLRRLSAKDGDPNTNTDSEAIIAAAERAIVAPKRDAAPVWQLEPLDDVDPDPLARLLLSFERAAADPDLARQKPSPLPLETPLGDIILDLPGWQGGHWALDLLLGRHLVFLGLATRPLPVFGALSVDMLERTLLRDERHELLCRALIRVVSTTLADIDWAQRTCRRISETLVAIRADSPLPATAALLAIWMVLTPAQLCILTGLSYAGVHKHLKALSAAGLIVQHAHTRQGRWRWQAQCGARRTLNPKSVSALVAPLQDAMDDLDRLLGNVAVGDDKA